MSGIFVFCAHFNIQTKISCTLFIGKEFLFVCYSLLKSNLQLFPYLFLILRNINRGKSGLFFSCGRGKERETGKHRDRKLFNFHFKSLSYFFGTQIKLVCCNALIKNFFFCPTFSRKRERGRKVDFISLCELGCMFIEQYRNIFAIYFIVKFVFSLRFTLHHSMFFLLVSKMI